MGQKVNPIGLRVGINKGWDSTWFAKKSDFGKYLIEDFKIRDFIKRRVIDHDHLADSKENKFGKEFPLKKLDINKMPKLFKISLV